MKLQLAQLRRAAGYKNRDDFAAVLGVRPGTYRDWEQGVSGIRLDMLCRIADILGCSTDAILGHEVDHNFVDQRQSSLNACFTTLDEENKDLIVQVAETFSKACIVSSNNVSITGDVSISGNDNNTVIGNGSIGTEDNSTKNIYNIYQNED